MVGGLSLDHRRPLGAVDHRHADRVCLSGREPRRRVFLLDRLCRRKPDGAGVHGLSCELLHHACAALHPDGGTAVSLRYRGKADGRARCMVRPHSRPAEPHGGGRWKAVRHLGRLRRRHHGVARQDLVPEMARRGYKQSMTLGPVMGSGGLAVMLPPSALGVILASTADISVGALLMAIIVPGLMMAVSIAAYIIVRCWLQPELAPRYRAQEITLRQKFRDTVVHVFPVAAIVFVVTGLIFMGIATPTESAALGVVCALVLARIYGPLDWKMVRLSLHSTMITSLMVLMILSGSSGFAQLMAYTGASQGIVE